jgi:hypothetical protein
MVECVQVAQLRDGMLCQEQDSLPGGISRESSMCERREPALPTSSSLAAALKDNWVGGPASHPLQEHGGAEGASGEEGMPDDGAEDYGGVTWNRWVIAPRLLLGTAPPMGTSLMPGGQGQNLRTRTDTTQSRLPCHAGTAGAAASSEEYSDVGEEGAQDTEVVYVRVSQCGAGSWRA